MKDLYIIGAGGLGKELAASLAGSRKFRFTGFFDDKYEEKSYANGTSKESYDSLFNKIKATPQARESAVALKDISTRQEKILGNALDNLSDNISFINKFPLDDLVVDFYSPEANLIIQLNDGVTGRLYSNPLVKELNIDLLRLHTYEVDKSMDLILNRLKYKISKINGSNGLNGKALIHQSISSLSSVTRSLSYIIGIGDPHIKQQLESRLEGLNHYFSIFTHEKAIITDPKNVSIKEGSIIMPGACITTKVSVGKHVLINLNCTIGHDVVIGDYSSLMPGSHISGCAQIGRGVLIGTGAVIMQGVKVGDNAKIGAGAVVTKDVPSGKTAVGVPAKVR